MASIVRTLAAGVFSGRGAGGTRAIPNVFPVIEGDYWTGVDQDDNTNAFAVASGLLTIATDGAQVGKVVHGRLTIFEG